MNETNFSCVRIAKVKTADGVKKCEAEHNRTNGFENRENINHEKTSFNKSMQNWHEDNLKSFEDLFNQQKKLYNENHKRGLRKDAVRMLDGVFILSEVPKGQGNLFSNSCVEFMKEMFPDCYWKLWAHLDEKTLHIHFGVCPIDKNGQCIADKTMKKENKKKMQTRFAQICQKNGLDIQRGISKEDRFNQGLEQNNHKSPWQYANECEDRAQKAKEAEKLAKISEEVAKKKLEEEKALHKKLTEKNAEIFEANEYLENENNRLAKENAKLTKEIENKTLLRGNEDFDFVGDCLKMNKDGWEEIAR